MEEIIKNPWVWIISGLVVLLLGTKVQWGSLFNWFKRKEPIDSTENLEDAVKHFIAIRDFCKGCPGAQKALEELWKNLLEVKKT